MAADLHRASPANCPQPFRPPSKRFCNYPLCLHSLFNEMPGRPLESFSWLCPLGDHSPGKVAGCSLRQMPVQLEVQLALKKTSQLQPAPKEEADKAPEKPAMLLQLM